MRAVLIAAFVMTQIAGCARAASTSPVFSIADLERALASAPANSVIAIAPGQYPTPVLKDLHLTNVTITSADPAHPAVFVGGGIKASSGVTFDHIDFESVFGHAFDINSSDHVQVVNSRIYSRGDPSTAGDGLGIWGSRNISVTGSEFHNLRLGLIYNTQEHLSIVGNTFHDIREHGIHGAQSNYVLVEDNDFTDFYPAPRDHPDAMFLSTSGVKVTSHDFIFRNNAVIKGKGARIQGVFVKDTSHLYPFSNVTVDGNWILGEGYNGIGINGAVSPVVTNNHVLSYGPHDNWLRLQYTSDAKVMDNEVNVLMIDNTNTGSIVSKGNKLKDEISPEEGVRKFTAWRSARDARAQSLRANKDAEARAVNAN